MSTVADAQSPEFYQGDFRELFRNRLAFSGGGFGALFACGLMAFLAFYFGGDCFENQRRAWEGMGREVYTPEFVKAFQEECPDETSFCRQKMTKRWRDEGKEVYTLEFGLAASEACPLEEDEYLDIDFTPGTLVKLGEEIKEEELPEKIVVQETREEEAAVEETVTEDEEAKPKDEEEKKEEDEPKKDKPPPREKKDKKLPTNKLPTTSNTPYKNDLPTVDVNKGDPFGDPGGWSDLKRDGDPWATDVMKALNNMKVGAYAAQGATGDFKFQLTICKDGSVKQVSKKGGSLPADAQNGVRLSLEQLDLPKPPPDVLKKMKSNCAKIRYTFVWSARGVR